ncbi:MAG: thioesterase domain-containing protein [Rhodococcus sp. (in: high G+C Gram-positive bacteria)]
MTSRRIDARLHSAQLLANLPDLLRRRAESHPNTPAVVQGNTTLSFRQLTDAATALAGRLCGARAPRSNSGAADIDELLSVQPAGPYMLWGHSFGARVAFEAAWQLEQSGRDVERVLLLCPGNPEVPTNTDNDTKTITEQARPRTADFSDPTFVTILLSVCTGRISGAEVDRCREASRDEATFDELASAIRAAIGTTRDLFPTTRVDATRAIR